MVVDCGGAIVVLVAECVLFTTVAGATLVLLVSVAEVDAPPPLTAVVELFTAVPVPSELTEVLLLTSSAKAGSDIRTVAAKVTPSVFEFNIVISLNEPYDQFVFMVSGEDGDDKSRVPHKDQYQLSASVLLRETPRRVKNLLRSVSNKELQPREDRDD